MDDALRMQVTEAAVMESLTENKIVREYFENHSGENTESVSIQQLLDYAETKSNDASNDPHMQILKDYFEKGAGQGKAEDYKILDYKFTKDFSGEKPNWETNALIQTPAKDSEGQPGLYVAFRGTAGDEWMPNASLMYEENSVQQQEALEYFESLVENEKFRPLFEESYVTLTGHSQGGNKGVYVTMTSQYGDYIDSCIVMDAPGHSPEAMEAFNRDPARYDANRSKITMVCGQYDYVHSMGERVVKDENLYYTKNKPVDGEKRFESMHQCQYFFEYDVVKDEDGKPVKDEDGNLVYKFSSTLAADAEADDFVLAQQKFMEEFNKLSQEERKKLALTLMKLMDMKNGKFVSPDGNDIDPDVLSAIQVLLNSEHGTEFISSLLLVLYPDLGKHTNPETVNFALETVKQILGPLVALWLFTGRVDSIIQRITEKIENKRLDRISRQEAAANPEFYLDPTLLANAAAADTGGRVGANINIAQKALQQAVKKPAPFRNISRASTASREGNEVSHLQILRNKVSKKQSEITSMQKDIENSIDKLEQVKESLNSIVDYMYNTVLEFKNVEKDIGKKVDDWFHGVMK